MSQHDGSNDRCIATTNAGRQCGNAARDGSEYCHLDAHGPEDGARSSADDGATMIGDVALPTARDSWKQFAPLLLAITGRDEHEDWVIETTAAKAVFSAVGGAGNAEYKAVFGSCRRQGCDNGANGFEADRCYDHQQADDDGDDDGDDGDDGDSDDVAEIVDSLGDDGKEAIKQLAEAL